MKNNLKINKSKLYHKLINKVIYSNKPLSRQKKSVAVKNQSSQNKILELEGLKKRINSIKNCDLKKMPQISYFLMVTHQRK